MWDGDNTLVYYGGATAVGIKTKKAVVLAAERRFSYGGFILSKTAKKVFKITDRIAVAGAGLIADIQAIDKIIKAEIRYYEVTMNKEITVKAAAKLLSSILYSYKFMPMFSEFIIGGRDVEGYHLYVMDPLGSLIEDDYAAIGSGAPIAIGIIESEYKDDLDISELKSIAVKSIKAAISRDSMSGDGIDLIVISNKVEEEFIRL